MECQQCGTEASAGARFCRRCGVELAGSSDADATAAGTPRVGGEAPLRGTTGAADAVTEARRPVEAATAGAGAAAPRHTAQDLETSVVATPADDAARRSCPSCGAPNSPRRELCGRCGADLDTGASPPRLTDDDVPDAPKPPTSPTHGPRRLSPWAVAGGALVAVAAVVGALTLAGFGPLAGEPSLPEATFTQEVYGDDLDTLVLSDIATSSTLPPSGGESYDATQMADDDPETAWNSDGSQAEDGVGETIDLFLAEPAWVQRLVISNGHQRDSESYADNARIRRAELRLDGREVLTVRFEDLGLQRQAVELPEPMLTTTVRLRVTEVFPGDTYPDLAVSGIGFEGWVARGEDVEIAEERAEVARAAPPTR